MLRRRFTSIRNYTTPHVNGRLAQIPKAYNPLDFESNVTKKWAGRKRLTLSNLTSKDGDTFRMVFPPPNVTGKLHLGHALTVAIQDTIVRLKLMRGHHVEWLAGFDHAGIATHSVVTNKLKSTQKGNIDPSILLKELENHALRNREKMKYQLEALGALLDWNREYYTLDENHSYVVKEAFMHLFHTGIIRRGDGLVNWCFALKSSIADIEVNEVDFKGRTSFPVPGYDNLIDFGLLYHCAYRLQNSDAKLIVATSRPETMFGDVAIAVNPTNEKYQEFIGKSVLNPVNMKIIPVIADARVKNNFGTGIVKISPAHDKLDFAIGVDHKLPAIKVFESDGKLNVNCGELQGMPRYFARDRVIKLLKDSGTLVDITEYTGSLGVCSRTQDMIEPMILQHWFFQTKEFSNKIVSCIKSGEFIVRPDNMQDVFLHQMSSVHDWCISRQIKWGHAIPAYHHRDFPDIWITASNKSAAKTKLEEKLQIQTEEDEILQDPDVLDTWFSSALIPLALSNWPDVDKFKEISLMETGHDILLFWVWRMTIMTLALIDKLPFRSVLLHGVVVDHYGRKMSKSKGNVIDPMHIIQGRGINELKLEAAEAKNSGELEKSEYDLRLFALEKEYPDGLPSCGADALRFSLLGQNIYDQDVTISLAYLENCKHLCNKLWQAMRLYYHYLEAEESFRVDEVFTPEKLTKLPMIDRWILTSLYDFMSSYELNIRNCKFHLVTEAIRKFFYFKYCDTYLEFAKLELKQKLNTQDHLQVMRFVLCTSVKLAHPFLPFVTEEMWGVLTENKEGLLIEAKLPLLNDIAKFKHDTISHQMEKILKLIKQVRSFKTRYFQGVKEPPNILVEIHKNDMDIVNVHSYIENLSATKLKFEILGRRLTSDNIGILFDIEGGRSCRISCSRADAGVVIPIMDEVRLGKLQTKLSKLKKQYENPAFQQHAPEDAKEKLRRKVELIQSRIDEANSKSLSTQPTDSPPSSPSS